MAYLFTNLNINLFIGSVKLMSSVNFDTGPSPYLINFSLEGKTPIHQFYSSYVSLFYRHEFFKFAVTEADYSVQDYAILTCYGFTALKCIDFKLF